MGFAIWNCTNTLIECNEAHWNRNGFYFNGSNSPTIFKGNLMKNNLRQLTLSGGAPITGGISCIGDQGTSLKSNFNKWKITIGGALINTNTDNGTTNKGNYFFCISSNPAPNTFYTPPVFNATTGINFATAIIPKISFDTPSNDNCSANAVNSVSPTDKDIDQVVETMKALPDDTIPQNATLDIILAKEFETEFKQNQNWVAKQMTYSYLQTQIDTLPLVGSTDSVGITPAMADEMNTEVLPQMKHNEQLRLALLDNADVQTFLSDYGSSSMNDFNQVQSLIKDMNFEDALTINNSINANLIPEQALKGAYTIMLTHLLCPDSVYTTDELNQLTLIAHTCVHTGGNGVLIARNILDQLYIDTTTLYGDRYTDSLYCAYNNNFRIRNTQLKQEKVNRTIKASSDFKWTLLPNPAKNKAEIILGKPAENKIQVELYAINGSSAKLKYSIEQGENKISIDISSLGDGIYICKLFTGNNTIQYKKLTVINH